MTTLQCTGKTDIEEQVELHQEESRIQTHSAEHILRQLTCDKGSLLRQTLV